MAMSAQQAELHAPTQADTLAEGKTANIYTDSRYAFRAAHDFGMLRKPVSLLSAEIKFKMAHVYRNYWM